MFRPGVEPLPKRNLPRNPNPRKRKVFYAAKPSVSVNLLGQRTTTKCLRPYHDENTRSRPITEVKHRRAGIVLGWGTAWELPVS